MRKYRVTLTAQASVSSTTEVEAENAFEAEHLAITQAKAGNIRELNELPLRLRRVIAKCGRLRDEDDKD